MPSARQRVRRIGVLMGLAADDPESQARLAAFAQGLQQAGWTVGQTSGSIIAGARATPISCASTLLSWSPVLPKSSWRIPARPLRPCCRRAAPFRSCSRGRRPGRRRLCQHLARPGGNVTGFTNFEYSIGGKWLELLKEIAPTSSASRFCGSRLLLPARDSSARSRPLRIRSAWRCGRSICAMRVRSSATSLHLQGLRMVA